MINSRTTQLEALIIDNEIQSIFSDGVKEILKIDIPEVNLFFDFMYYRERITKNMPFPGQQLQNIEYCTKLNTDLGKKQKISYLLLMVIGKYLFRRLSEYSQKHNMKLSKILVKMKQVFQASEIVYFLIFLAKGQMVQSLVLYLIGYGIRQRKDNATRELDFELVNRVVIWEVINKLMQFVLTTSNYLLNSAKQLFFISSFLGNLQQAHVTTQCFICNEQIKTLETKLLPCEHSFCYYCSNSNGDKCPQCNQKIEEIKRI